MALLLQGSSYHYRPQNGDLAVPADHYAGIFELRIIRPWYQPPPLEAQITEAGGQFDAGGILHLHVVSDGRLVTGQNPFSTALTAEATIRAMGGEPRARVPYRNENTMDLAKFAAEDESVLRDALALMQSSAPYFQHDNVTLAMPSAQERLGDFEAAREILTGLLELSPDSDVAREQLAALGN